MIKAVCSFLVLVGLTSVADATCFVSCAASDGAAPMRICYSDIGWLIDLGACEAVARSINHGGRVCTGEWAPLQSCANPQTPPAERPR